MWDFRASGKLSGRQVVFRRLASFPDVVCASFFRMYTVRKIYAPGLSRCIGMRDELFWPNLLLGCQGAEMFRVFRGRRKVFYGIRKLLGPQRVFGGSQVPPCVVGIGFFYLYRFPGNGIERFMRYAMRCLDRTRYA